MNSLKGDLAQKTRLELAKKVFRHTSKYDAVIADYLTKVIENVK
jgi:AICAR transformylase/IMP cyclohydrolase PurH